MGEGGQVIFHVVSRGGGVMVNNEWSLSMQTLIQKFHAVKELWKLPLNKVQFYEDPKNIHKIFRPPKIFIFLKTPQNIEVHNFETKEMALALLMSRYYQNKAVFRSLGMSA